MARSSFCNLSFLRQICFCATSQCLHMIQSRSFYLHPPVLHGCMMGSTSISFHAEFSLKVSMCLAVCPLQLDISNKISNSDPPAPGAAFLHVNGNGVDPLKDWDVWLLFNLYDLQVNQVTYTDKIPFRYTFSVVILASIVFFALLSNDNCYSQQFLLSHFRRLKLLRCSALRALCGSCTGI